MRQNRRLFEAKQSSRTHCISSSDSCGLVEVMTSTISAISALRSSGVMSLSIQPRGPRPRRGSSSSRGGWSTTSISERTRCARRARSAPSGSARGAASSGRARGRVKRRWCARNWSSHRICTGACRRRSGRWRCGWSLGNPPRIADTGLLDIHRGACTAVCTHIQRSHRSGQRSLRATRSAHDEYRTVKEILNTA